MEFTEEQIQEILKQGKLSDEEIKEFINKANATESPIT